MRLTLSLLVILLIVSCSNKPIGETTSSGIRNTATFITYFNSISNVLSFQKVKDSVQKLGTEIKGSAKISAENKVILRTFYNDMQAKSEGMYNQVVSDLMNKSRRREILDNVTGYIQSLNVQFDGLYTSVDAFKRKYTEVNPDRGIGWIWQIVKNIALSFAEGFVREIIDEVVRQKLENELKPKLVIKRWDAL